MEVKMNLFEFQGAQGLYKFIHVVDNTENLWFAGKSIVEMLQNNSMNTDRAINKIDTCYRKKLQDIMIDFKTFDKLPKCLQEKSIMINVEGVKRLINENTVANDAKKIWIHEKINTIVNNGEFESNTETPNMPCTIFEKIDTIMSKATETPVNKSNAEENITNMDSLQENSMEIAKYINPESNQFQIKEFNFESKTVTFRYINGPDCVWFVGKDVANMLEYSDTVNAIKQHVSDYNIQKLDGMVFHHPEYINLSYLQNHTKLINEAGLYELIIGSKMSKAQEFKKWLTCEVLPSLRKTGHYSMQQASMKDAENLNTINRVIEGSNAPWYEEKIKMLEELREKDRQMQEKDKELLKFETIEIQRRYNERQQYQNEIEQYRKREYQLKENMLKKETNVIKHFAIDQNTKLNLCKEMFTSHASEVPKEIGAYPVLEVYIIPREFLPTGYDNLYGYTCSRVQKKQSGKKAKLNEYEQIYITESPNAINAWRCVKDRLKVLKDNVFNHNKHIFNKDEWLPEITCINKGNTIYCSLNKNEMLNLLKKRCYGFKEEKPKLAKILTPSTISSKFMDEEESTDEDEDKDVKESMITEGIQYYNDQEKLMSLQK